MTSIAAADPQRCAMLTDDVIYFGANELVMGARLDPRGDDGYTLTWTSIEPPEKPSGIKINWEPDDKRMRPLPAPPEPINGVSRTVRVKLDGKFEGMPSTNVEVAPRASTVAPRSIALAIGDPKIPVHTVHVVNGANGEVGVAWTERAGDVEKIYFAKLGKERVRGEHVTNGHLYDFVFDGCRFAIVHANRTFGRVTFRR